LTPIVVIASGLIMMLDLALSSPPSRIMNIHIMVLMRLRPNRRSRRNLQ
jgi:hypothetical protein